jgi:hypothetical protein
MAYLTQYERSVLYRNSSLQEFVIIKGLVVCTGPSDSINVNDVLYPTAMFTEKKKIPHRPPSASVPERLSINIALLAQKCKKKPLSRAAIGCSDVLSYAFSLRLKELSGDENDALSHCFKSFIDMTWYRMHHITRFQLLKTRPYRRVMAVCMDLNRVNDIPLPSLSKCHSLLFFRIGIGQRF